MIFDSNEPLLSIGIAAKKLRVSPELLRLYEREGLVIIHKTKSGHRLFSKSDLEWIECFRKHITEKSLNIAGVRALLAQLPCWDHKSKCSKTNCKNCKAYKNSTIVCWMLSGRELNIYQGTNCRECKVYKHACQADKLNHMYVEINNNE